MRHSVREGGPSSLTVATQYPGRDGDRKGPRLWAVRLLGERPVSSPDRAGSRRKAPSIFRSRRRPEETVLYRVVQENYRSFLAICEEEDRPLPASVRKEFEEYLSCLAASSPRALPVFGVAVGTIDLWLFRVSAVVSARTVWGVG